MIKLTYFLHRLPEWSRAEFLDYWHTHHAELIRSHAATFGICRYVQCTPADHPRNLPNDAFPERYDGLAELWFRAPADLEIWFSNSTPEAIAAGKAIRADERKFIDRARSPFMIGEERPIIEETAAAPPGS